ncbi:hypothetical protein [Tautonia plasticadhaerens]|uniref:Uncharacterized protein n=1 Tax=Tautonia plasticadhaerens TaxID=2527974 RepID=A0A518GZK9_9BACT|nr:hypothetical protein [Tautonia plasticadhaerens]QDV34038.1 hypothetical protein ElP_19190 [Tautonia plasticadhaerens]
MPARRYLTDQHLGTGDGRAWAMICWHRDSGHLVARDGAAGPGDFDPARHLHPITEYPAPRLGIWRSEVPVDGPEGWYSISLHELAPDGTPRPYPATGSNVSVGLSVFYHDPTGRRDSDGELFDPPPPPGRFNLLGDLVVTPAG